MPRKLSGRSAVAVDPGSSSGAYAVAVDGVVVEVDCLVVPKDPQATLRRIADLAHKHRGAEWAIENVGWGRPGESIRAANSFSRHRGHLDMAMEANGIEVTWYAPNKWIREFLGDDAPTVAELKLVRMDHAAMKKLRKNAIYKKVCNKCKIRVYKYQADAVALLLHHLNDT